MAATPPRSLRSSPGPAVPTSMPPTRTVPPTRAPVPPVEAEEGAGGGGLAAAGLADEGEGTSFAEGEGEPVDGPVGVRGARGLDGEVLHFEPRSTALTAMTGGTAPRSA